MKLKTDGIISEPDLTALAREFEQEAKCLLEGGLYTAAVYLGGYAIECWLKVAICRSLRQPGLSELFKSHDLGGLLYYSGFQQDLDSDATLRSAFDGIVGAWNDKHGNPAKRYGSRSKETRSDAEVFLTHVDEVREWLIARL